jgi:apolipoprotein N-acyltransferase
MQPLIIIKGYVGTTIITVYLFLLLYSIYLILQSDKTLWNKVLWVIAMLAVPFLFVFLLLDVFLLSRKKV